MSRPLVLKKRSKFGAVRSEYGGRIYHSKREAAHAYSLDLLKMAGEVTEWFPQVDAALIVNGKLVCHYKVDFEVHYANHTREWHEVKGMDTAVGRLKMKLFEACYPERTLKVIR